MTAAAGDRLTLEAGQLQVLLDVLRDRGYCTVGPVVRDGAILYDEISRTEDLPLGWTDQQEAGTYRLAEMTRLSSATSLDLSRGNASSTHPAKNSGRSKTSTASSASSRWITP
jgi:hypothetical protein